VAAVVGAGACDALQPNLNRVIALALTVGDSVETGDTLRAHAVAVTAGGDSSTGGVHWASFDTTVLAVPDSTMGTFVGVRAGTTSIQAHTGGLLSNPIAITVTPAADTLALASTAFDTISVTARDSVSDSLAVTVADTMSNAPNPPTLTPLAGRLVSFAVVRTPPGATVTLITADTAHALATTTTVATGTDGLAAVQVRYLGGAALPDSVVVAATATRANGTVLAGSPVTFVIQLTP